ncbi:MAG: isocitrate/isopropylmalate dehydrogenase [Gammaproteobacteria bacterium]|jgi:isocitrate/isopropylmalate dehydrogenase
MKIAVLPCDAIGPEISRATLTVLRAAKDKFGLDLTFDEYDVGKVALESHGTTLPEPVIDAVMQADAFILGPHDNMSYPPASEGGINVSSYFRKRLDLFGNIRPAKSQPGLAKIQAPMDLVIVRENTEGFYSDRNMFAGHGEFMPTEDLALSVRKISAVGSNRIARMAFELAATRPRKKVTAVHKVNVLTLSDGLFLREVRKVAQDYPAVELEEVLVDAMAALLVREPQRFDVVVTTNLFGDVLSDEASELSGSLGLAPSLNASLEAAMAQAQHGSAPDIAGQNKANPTSLILSSAMLLDWLGSRGGSNALCEAAAAMSGAVEKTLANALTRTADVGGTLGTQEFANVVAKTLLALD